MISGTKEPRIEHKVTYTKITEVNLSAFAYRLFQEDFSSILGAKCHFALRIEEKSS